MWVLIIWLVVDGAGYALAVSRALPAIGYDGASWTVLLICRLMSSALSLASAASLIARRPQGRALAPAALAISALIGTIDAVINPWSLGALSPYRWPIAAFFWLWTLGWTRWLRRFS